VKSRERRAPISAFGFQNFRLDFPSLTKLPRFKNSRTRPIIGFFSTLQVFPIDLLIAEM
jgi:hypothetical protein